MDEAYIITKEKFELLIKYTQFQIKVKKAQIKMVDRIVEALDPFEKQYTGLEGVI